MSLNFEDLKGLIYGWANDKSLLKPENKLKQFCKVSEEVGEIGGALCRNDIDLIKDSIGDTFVTLIIFAKQNDLDPVDCLESAWNEIKNRKGITVDGSFIKEKE